MVFELLKFLLSSSDAMGVELWTLERKEPVAGTDGAVNEAEEEEE